MLGLRGRKVSDERGDTIIEVLFALAVLGAVIAITINLMNSGFATMMSSMDRTNTQAIMNGQAALLRAARDKYIEGDTAAWDTIRTTYVNTLAAKPGACGATDPAAVRFYMNPSAAKPWMPVDRSSFPVLRIATYPRPGDGMWIEAYKVDPDGAGTQPNYYDFYIKACWRGYGDNSVKQEAKMVVRLYDSGGVAFSDTVVSPQVASNFRSSNVFVATLNQQRSLIGRVGR